MRRSVVVMMVLSLVACAKKEPSANGSSSEPRAAASTKGGAAAQASREEPAPPAESAVGGKMPDYSTDMLDGKKFEVASERGNVVLLNVWATWCGPCRYEIPELEILHNGRVAKGFKVVGISVDEGGAEGVRQFVKEHKMTYPIALDGEGRITNLLQTTVLPTSVLIDRSGQIVWKHFGLVNTKDVAFLKALDAALAQKKG